MIPDISTMYLVLCHQFGDQTSIYAFTNGMGGLDAAQAQFSQLQGDTGTMIWAAIVSFPVSTVTTWVNPTPPTS